MSAVRRRRLTTLACQGKWTVKEFTENLKMYAMSRSPPPISDLSQKSHICNLKNTLILVSLTQDFTRLLNNSDVKKNSKHFQNISEVLENPAQRMSKNSQRHIYLVKCTIILGLLSFRESRKWCYITHRPHIY